MHDTTALAPSNTGSPFDEIRQVRPDGTEFWSARKLAQILEYETWRNFSAAIDRAMLAAENTKTDVTSEFVGVNKLVPYGNDAYRSIEDYELSRFACYLVAMNGDPRKSAIASAQAYFAIRTRQAERIETVVRDEIATAKGRMELLGLAKGLIDDRHLEAKARLVLARGLGEAPELDLATTPLYAQTYLEQKGVAKDEIKSISPTFGKRIKAAFVLKHGCEPKQYPLETKSGQIRPVNAYTEADRSLFDDVWDQYYAKGDAA
ncbi:hypothetical protein GS466_25015 [Rhodococcus hoagii]|nr:hypothetical protein [Prescottella equi]